MLDGSPEVVGERVARGVAVVPVLAQGAVDDRGHVARNCGIDGAEVDRVDVEYGLQERGLRRAVDGTSEC